MSENDDDLAALRERTSHGDRLDEAPSEQSHSELVADIVAELEAIDRGEKQKTVSVWDGYLAAFIHALDEDGTGESDRFTEVGHALQAELDLDESEADRSDVIRLALRLGFETAVPEHFEAVRDAAREHAGNSL